MSDILIDIGGGLKKRFKDMGDGTVAEVIYLGGGGGAIGSISGTYKVGQTLTFTPSTGYTVTAGNWTRDGANISGATSLTYTQVSADAGHVISFTPSTWSYSAPGGTTAADVPGAPTIGTASAGDSVATINWTAPASNGGSAITGYKITGSNGNIVTASAGATSAQLPAVNGTPVTAVVQALNAIGYGPASAASNSVTPSAVMIANYYVTPGTSTANGFMQLVTMRDSGKTEAIIRNNTRFALVVVEDTTDNLAINQPSVGSYTTLPAGQEAVFAGSIAKVWVGSKDLAMSSVTSSGTTVTVVFPVAHNMVTGDLIRTIDFVPAGYNASLKSVTVVDAFTITYQVASAPGAVTTTGHLFPTIGHSTNDVVTVQTKTTP